VGRRKRQPEGLIIALVTMAFVVLVGMVFLLSGAVELPSRSRLVGPRPTLANYNRVTLGMSKAQVVKILGSDYTAEAEFEGKIFDSDLSVEVLVWNVGLDRQIAITLRNNSVMSKAQGKRQE
jgi:hypothetical protein